MVKGVQFTSRGAVRVGELAKRMKSLPESQFLKVWNGLGNISSRTKAYLYTYYKAVPKPKFIDEVLLSNLADQLYRSTDKIPGGSAGALRYERLTGTIVGSKPHITKVTERINHIKRLLNDPLKLHPEDLRNLKIILNDLEDAIKTPIL